MLIHDDGQYRRFFSIFFADNDPSIYIIPFASKDKYYYGEQFIPAGDNNLTFDWSKGNKSNVPLKLSIHASGQVHIYPTKGNPEPRAGPVTIPSLPSLTGQHVATIQAQDTKTLPVYSKPLSRSGDTIDLPFDGLRNGIGLKVCICINGTKPQFGVRWTKPVIGFGKRSQRERKRIANINRINANTYFRVDRPGFDPLYVQPAVLPPVPNCVIGGPRIGVVVLAGFNPCQSKQQGTTFLWIRGE